MGRLVGEGIKKYTTDQIKVRQLIAGSGIGDTSRSVDFLQIQNNRNAWLKLGSSVKVLTAEEMLNEIKKNNKDTDLKAEDIKKSRTTGFQRLKDLGFPNPETFMGIGLATEAVLFNSLSKVTPPTYENIEGPYTFRSGVTDNKSIWNNSAYGLGGNLQGLVPPPGLIDAKIEALNRGSIRKAVVNIKAHNKFQFELIELLYLRLGYTMLLEWGWDKYIHNPSDGIEKVGNAVMENTWFGYNDSDYSISFKDVIDQIEEYRSIYKGNYDGFVGRVSNFSWDFDSDGTYNITLNLITVGDVIESLKINHPQRSINKSDILRKITSYNSSDNRDRKGGEDQELSEDSSIVTTAGDSTLAYNLFLDIIDVTTEEKWKGKKESNYFNLFNSKLGEEINTYTVAKNDGSGNTEEKYFSSDDYIERDKYGYFLTFGELLSKIQKLCIHSVSNSSVINIDTNEKSNLMVAYPNQISLDPRIAFTKPTFDDSLRNKKLSPRINLDTNHRKLKQWFTVDSKNKNCIYGQIMNLYINYDFISKCLEKTTKKGEVFLFKFLQNLCDGINSAMGGVNNLEPVIEDDYNIKIQEQNKIKGIETSEFSSNFRDDDDVDFELFGYNLGNSTSNIVRKFNFETKIKPDLASMISIGATANGTSTKNYDATAFSNWNSGLQDQFQLDFIDPLTVDENQKDKDIYNNSIFDKNEIAILSSSFAKADIDFYPGPDIPIAFGYVRSFKESALTPKDAYGITFFGERSPDDNTICNMNAGVYYNWEKYVKFAEGQKLTKLKQEQNEKNRIKTVNDRYGFGNDYIEYLVRGFGGVNKNGDTKITNLYYTLNSDFIKKGKSLFKAYVDNIDNVIYEKYGNPSTKIGFIPLDLSLESDGISGIKLYNRLNIQQDFLPKQYPKAVEFLIKNVNHTISDNDWSTELKTISTPKTNSSPALGLNFEADNKIKANIEALKKSFTSSLKRSLTTGINIENNRSRTTLIYDPEVITNKNQIVLHHTAGNQTPGGYILGWKKKDYPLATHYIIPREGQTEQVFADEYWSNHLGTQTKNTPTLQKRSLSIELSNYGWVKLVSKSKGKFVWQTWSGQTLPDDQIAKPYQIWKDGSVIPMHGGYKGYGRFQKYTPSQIQSLKTILEGWKSKYNIPIKLTYDNFRDLFPTKGTTSKNALGEITGLYTHNSYRTDKVDIFPQKELLEMLMGLDGGTTTTTTSSRSQFVLQNKFLTEKIVVNNRTVSAYITYDDGKRIENAAGQVDARSSSSRDISIAKAKAILEAKDELIRKLNS